MHFVQFLLATAFFNYLTVEIAQGVDTCSKTVSATSQEAFTDKAILYLFPQASEQSYVTSICATSAKQIFTDNEFQLHEPDTPSHGDDAFPVEFAEELFQKKWDVFLEQKQDFMDGKIDYLLLDPFFDHNFAMYVTDLTQNLKVLQDQENSDLEVDVPYVILKWSLDTSIDDHQDFISVLLYLPNTQIIYELVTEYDDDVLGDYLENEVMIEVEQRASFIGLDFIDDLPWESTDEVIPLRQGRAVSDIDVNVLWYQKYMKAVVVESGSESFNGQSVEYTYVTLPYTSNFTIGFYKRENIDDDSFTIKDFENGINAVHKELVLSPNCQYDRWFDNHYHSNYYYESLTDDAFCELWDELIYQSTSQRYVVFKYLKEDADEVSVEMFDEYGIDYVWFLNLIEPNGNTIEVVGYCDDQKMKSTANPFDGVFCNLCSDSEIQFDSDWIDNGEEFRANTGVVLPQNKKIHNKFSKDHLLLLSSGIFIAVILLGFLILYFCTTCIRSSEKMNLLQNDNEQTSYGTV